MLFISVLAFSSCSTNANRSIEEKNKTDEKVKLINEEVEKMNKDSTITARKFIRDSTYFVNWNREYIDYGDGWVACYIKNDTIVKIVHNGEPSFGSGFTKEYYFHNTQLTFVSEWGAMSFDGKTTTTLVDKYYFNNGELIKTDMSKDHTPKSEKTLLAETKKLVDFFKGK